MSLTVTGGPEVKINDKAPEQAIDADQIAKWASELNNDQSFLCIKDAAFKHGTQALSVNQAAARAHDHAFSNKIPNEGKATSQKSSGRCWIFAALNTLRIPFAKAQSVQLDGFEFSQNYVFFWDKFEKCNYVLEVLIETVDKEDAEGRLWSHILKAPVIDGGQFEMFVNVVQKYGVVPKNVFPDSADSGNSRMLNWLIANKLRETAAVFKKMRADSGVAAGEASPPAALTRMREHKMAVLRQIHRALCIHLGTPPSTTASFKWRYTNASKKHAVCPEEHTPVSFAKTLLPDLSLNVSFINDPRNEYNRAYTVEYLGNVWGGRPTIYINVDIDTLRYLTVNTIVEREEPVWFGCDSGKYGDREGGIWDVALYDWSRTLGTNIGAVNSKGDTGFRSESSSSSISEDGFVFDKKQRLIFSDSLMTHAMVFTGVDLDEQKQPQRFRIENSWGEKNGDKGYYSCSKAWFDEYVYQIVLSREQVPKDAGIDVDAILAKPHTVLPLWDPMGALATN